MEPASKGDWAPWPFHLEPHDGLPGSPNDQSFSTVDYLKSLVRSSSEGTKSFDLVVTWPTGRPAWLTDREVTAGPFKAAAARIEALSSDPDEVSSEQGEQLDFLIDASRRQLKSTFAAQNDAAQNDSSRHADILALTIALGILRDNVLWLGFDCIDHLEWTEWMAANGCSKPSLDSAVARGCYDYVFGFVKGHRKVGAGTGGTHSAETDFRLSRLIFLSSARDDGRIDFCASVRSASETEGKIQLLHPNRQLRIVGGRCID
jgi:hypothetical protein